MQAKGWSVSQQNRRRALLSGLIVVVLFVLCGVLGFLQYRWIGEVSVAARERLRGSLQASLNRFSREFNQELAAATFTLVPNNASDSAEAAEASLSAHYAEWRKETHRERIFTAIGLAIPKDGTTTFKMLDLDSGTLHPAEWPASWSSIKDRLEAMAAGGPRRGGSDASEDGLVFEMPLFGGGGGGFPSGGGRRGGGRGRDFGPPDGPRGMEPPAPPPGPPPDRRPMDRGPGQ